MRKLRSSAFGKRNKPTRSGGKREICHIAHGEAARRHLLSEAEPKHVPGADGVTRIFLNDACRAETDSGVVKRKVMRAELYLGRKGRTVRHKMPVDPLARV